MVVMVGGRPVTALYTSDCSRNSSSTNHDWRFKTNAFGLCEVGSYFIVKTSGIGCRWWNQLQHLSHHRVLGNTWPQLKHKLSILTPQHFSRNTNSCHTRIICNLQISYIILGGQSVLGGQSASNEAPIVQLFLYDWHYCTVIGKLIRWWYQLLGWFTEKWW